jgi:large subunit ribosomal protein L25
MEEIAIQLEQREVTGKAVRQLRKQGLIPAVIHDHGKPSVIVMGQFTDLTKADRQAGKHHPVSLKAGNKQYMALIKTVEFDPKKHLLRHVVFGAVKANETVTAEIPIHIVYDEGNDASPAERNSLIVLTQLDAVEVEARPNDLPDAIEISGESLVEVGDQLTVADIKVPESVVIKTEPTHPVATVFEPSALQAANDDAGGDQDEATETSAEGEAGADTAGTSEEAASSDAAAKDKEEKKD